MMTRSSPLGPTGRPARGAGSVGALLASLVAAGIALAADSPAPYLASGIKIGEVGATTALVWVRLTRDPERVRSGIDYPITAQRPWESEVLPDGADPATIVGACPSVPGEARLRLRPTGDSTGAAPTPWQAAGAAADGVIVFALEGLRPATRYQIVVETRTGPEHASAQRGAGAFRTAAAAGAAAPVTFTVITGMLYRHLDHADGFEIFPSMARLDPDFLVSTGDSVYYDRDSPAARTPAIARVHWERLYSLPRLRDFHAAVPGYWMKDDHDTFQNDCWPGMAPIPLLAPLTFEEGRRLFLEQVPMGPLTYRRFRHGAHLEVWLVEGRDFRSENDAPDGPGKTIWGAEQLAWLRETLLASTATFRVLISPTPIVGPDRSAKADNHANRAFRTEGEGFRTWAKDNLPPGFFIVCGDRHWQYHSVDVDTGLEEFACGPASDAHASDAVEIEPAYHRYHREAGGFLSVAVDAEGGVPRIRFRHHDVQGKVLREVERGALDALPASDPTPPARRLDAALLAPARAALDARAAEVAALVAPEAIRERQQRIRRTLEASIGGLPERTPLAARTVGVIERDDVRLEKVIFESRPGFPVTANLWLPRRGAPPYPAILVPCGHSLNGKAYESYQAAAQGLVRRGFAALVYDPIGQGERLQLLAENGEPIARNTDEHSLTGAAALVVGSHAAALRIWDGIRAVDYLESRPDIDGGRLGVTGNSGGGTMSAYLMAFEPRLRAAAPSCYLTSMARLLETIGPQDAEQNFTGFVAAGLDHADFLHAFAPRPVLIACASGDYFDIGGTWSTFREAKRIYGRLGAPEAVDLIEADGSHGFQAALRQAAGRFFERALLGRAAPEIVHTVEEGPAFDDSELRVTQSGQVLLDGGARSSFEILRARARELAPARAAAFATAERGAWLARVRSLAGMENEIAAPKARRAGTVRIDGHAIELWHWSEPWPVTAALLAPAGAGSGEPPLLWIDGAGKAATIARAIELARAGRSVVALDLPGMGESAPARAAGILGADWQQAFLALHLGRTLAGIRADAIRQALRHLERRAGIREVEAIAGGAATLPALLAAAVEPAIARLELRGGWTSWSAAVEAPPGALRPADAIPGALEHFDLPLLIEAMAPRPVRRQP